MSKPAIDPAIFRSAEYAANPYPTLRLLRDHYPVYHNPVTGQWMITRYDDVVATFRDNVNFSASPNGDHIGSSPLSSWAASCRPSCP